MCTRPGRFTSRIQGSGPLALVRRLVTTRVRAEANFRTRQRVAGQDNPSTQCIVGDVPEIWDGVESDHDGPYDGVEMGC